jgi:hypothetical protein
MKHWEIIADNLIKAGWISNEKEISHGRVLWQTDWSCFAKGPLASSTG